MKTSEFARIKIIKYKKLSDHKFVLFLVRLAVGVVDGTDRGHVRLLAFGRNRHFEAGQLKLIWKHFSF